MPRTSQRAIQMILPSEVSIFVIYSSSKCLIGCELQIKNSHTLSVIKVLPTAEQKAKFNNSKGHNNDNERWPKQISSSRNNLQLWPFSSFQSNDYCGLQRRGRQRRRRSRTNCDICTVHLFNWRNLHGRRNSLPPALHFVFSFRPHSTTFALLVAICYNILYCSATQLASVWTGATHDLRHQQYPNDIQRKHGTCVYLVCQPAAIREKTRRSVSQSVHSPPVWT